MARIFFSLLLLSWPLAAQTSAGDQQADELQLSRVHVGWPTPEILLENLRSTDGPTRLKALTLLGDPRPQYSINADAKKGIPATTGVYEPDELELRYESLNDDSDQREAIVGAVIESSYIYGAVAIQTQTGWERIANFSCWCKYEDGDLLAGFMQVDDGPNGSSELVVRASGGGTGLYDQSESHFRVHKGELRTVLSFTRRFRECPWSPSGNGVCDGAHRWFHSQAWGQVQGGVLVESKFRFNIPEDHTPRAEYSIPELERVHAQPPTCTKYVWDEKQFAYTKSSAAHACRETEIEK